MGSVILAQIGIKRRLKLVYRGGAGPGDKLVAGAAAALRGKWEVEAR